MCGGEDAFLLVAGASGGADAGGDKDGAGADGFAQGGEFEGGADEALDAGFEGEAGEVEDLFFGAGLDVDGTELLAVHGGEDGDPEEGEFRGVLGAGLFGPAYHLRAACCVEGEHFDGEGGDALDGLGHGVGDVVELEIEEDAVSAVGDLTDEVGAVGGEELEADLDPLDGAVKAVEEGEGFLAGGQVEGEDELAAAFVWHGVGWLLWGGNLATGKSNEFVAVYWTRRRRGGYSLKMSLEKEEILMRSPAKVNLMLSVHGPREDGFHELTSLVAATGFGDELRVRPAESDSLECTDAGLPAGRENLVLRAAEVFRRRSGLDLCFAVFLEKRIPVGAGLGGGSGNAAAALQAMNRLAGEPLDGEALGEAAAELGSDCAFFLDGRPAVLRGRGERVELLPAEASERLAGRRLLLFKPGFAISTAWAYGRLRSEESPGDYEPEAVAQARLEGFLGGGPVEDLLVNNFEPAVGRKFPAIPLLLEDLQEMGVPCRMSGSGSCCFALPDEEGPPVEKINGCIRAAWGEEAFFVETFVFGTKT